MIRIIAASALSFLIVLSGAVPASAQSGGGKSFKVTLLGTGTPLPLMQRSGPAILVQAGGKNFLFE